MTRFSEHTNYLLHSSYKLNLQIFPNWSYYLLILPLLKLFTPFFAEKIFLTAMIGLFPISFLYFLRSTNRGENVFAIAGFLFSYNYLVMLGFYNFILGCDIFFFVLGYWYRHRDRMTAQRIGVLYLLLLLLFLSHATTFFLFLVVSTSLLVSRAIRRIAARPVRSEIKQQVKQLFQFAGIVLPASFILLADSLHRSVDPWHRSFSYLLDYLIHFRSLVYFSPFHIPWMYGLLLLFAAAIVITIFNPKTTGDSKDFILAGIVVLILYFVLPWGYGSGGWSYGGWLNDRIHFLLFLLIIPWLNVENYPIFRKIFFVSLLVITLVHLGRTFFDFYMINQNLYELQNVCRTIPNHSIVRLSGKDPGSGLNDYLSPYKNAAAYCGLEQKDILPADNYEANFDFFPLITRTSIQPKPDYIIQWDQHPSLAKIQNITSNNEFWHTDSNEMRWIGFDFEPQPVVTIPNFVSIGLSSIFQPGGFGWFNGLGRTGFGVSQKSSPSQAGMLLGDFLGSKEDGLFLLSLPNGKYNVGCFFYSGDGGGHQINILANDQLVIAKLNIAAGKYLRRDYQIKITNEKLAQVIYTDQKLSADGRLHDHWVMSGFIVQAAK
ncbi:MAG: hypothetical protein C5B54_00100 [Acidobacteria bacterium]|nr:MAG: hypothetical protein C5B54_00100 [Acidobacteriota bacterium]